MEASTGTRVVVRAPATSANLGPGFDALGLALDLWNEVTASVAEGARGLPERLPDGGPNLVLAAARHTAEHLGWPLPPLRLAPCTRIPVGRGLGSSAAAIACGVLLADHLLDGRLEPDDLLRLAARVEGHPDNVAPCLLGGARVAVLGPDGQVVQAPIPLARGLEAALFVPEARLSTQQARARLPRQVPFADAVFNVGRASLLVAALASGELGALREAMADRLHQPYRAPLFPAGQTLIQAALDAGALGACVSGAGPSILALCSGGEQARSVADAMAVAASARNVPGQPLCLALTLRGAHVVPRD